VILACDLVVANGWHELRTGDPRVTELSELLQRLPIHPLIERPPTFRSADSVSRKTADLYTAHPDYGGRPTRGGRVDRGVVADFLRDPVSMSRQAAAIRAAACALSVGSRAPARGRPR
jgi:5-methylcytosine-specific restriction enzyme A